MLQLSKPHGVDNAIVIVFTKTVPIQDPLKTESDAATRTDHPAAPEEDDDIFLDGLLDGASGQGDEEWRRAAAQATQT